MRRVLRPPSRRAAPRRTPAPRAAPGVCRPLRAVRPRRRVPNARGPVPRHADAPDLPAEPFAPPPAFASRHVVVCDVHGVAWRVLDVVPAVTNGGGASGDVSWATPPAAGATGRAFIALVDGGKRVRVLDRHRTDPWDDLSLPTLRGQLDDAYAPPPGWVARHSRSHPVPSSLRHR